MADCIVTKHCFYLAKRCKPGEIVQFDGEELPSYLKYVSANTMDDDPKPKRSYTKKED